MKYTKAVICTLWLLAGCSGIMHFVYYEPQANGWQLRHPAPGEPDDEVIYRGRNYAITVSAMTLSTNLKFVGPPFLPVVPTVGENEQVAYYEPKTINIYMHFLMHDEAHADVDFSSIKIVQRARGISVRSVYRLSNSSLEKKRLVSVVQTITSPSTEERKRGQYPEYQLAFPWADDIPDTFSVIIPANAIRISDESVPATVINFKKKSTSKYQYFP